MFDYTATMQNNELQCDKCGNYFSGKYELNRHQKSSKCASNSKTTKKIEFSCIHCKKKFGRKDVLSRHLKICKKKPITKISNSKVNNKKLMNNNTGSKVTANGNGNENHITIDHSSKKEGDTYIEKKGDLHIHLHLFGKDGPDSVITNIGELTNSNCNIFEKLLESVNFDPNKPQYHNVYCSDLKSGVGHVYEKDGWNTKCISEVLNKILDSKTSDIIKTLELNGDALNDKAKNKLKSAIDQAREAIIGHDGKSYPPGTRKQLMKFIKQIIYNKRNIALDTKQKIKNNSKKKSKNKYISSSDDESFDS